MYIYIYIYVYIYRYNDIIIYIIYKEWRQGLVRCSAMAVLRNRTTPRRVRRGAGAELRAGVSSLASCLSVSLILEFKNI